MVPCWCWALLAELERSASDGRPFPVFGVDGVAVAAVVLLGPTVATTGVFGVEGVVVTAGAMGFVSVAIGVSGEAGGGRGSGCL